MRQKSPTAQRQNASHLAHACVTSPPSHLGAKQERSSPRRGKRDGQSHAMQRNHIHKPWAKNRHLDPFQWLLLRVAPLREPLFFHEHVLPALRDYTTRHVPPGCRGRVMQPHRARLEAIWVCLFVNCLHCLLCLRPTRPSWVPSPSVY